MFILTSLKRAWMRFAFVLGWVNARILLTLLYFIFLAPFAIVRRIILLFSKKKFESYWIEKEMPAEGSLESFRRPF